MFSGMWRGVVVEWYVSWCGELMWGGGRLLVPDRIQEGGVTRRFEVRDVELVVLVLVSPEVFNLGERH